MTGFKLPIVRITRAHIALLAICSVLVFAPAARAESINQAGVIVDYGEGSTSWIWVPFEDAEVTVLDILERSEVELVTVGFGGLGDAVCQIGPSGCSVEDCRKRLCQTNASSPFWRLYVLDGDTWRMAGNGVSGTTLVDGDIVALSWGSDTPILPVVSMADLATNAHAAPDHAAPVAAIYTEGEAGQVAESAVSWGPTVSILGIVALASGVLMYRARGDEREAA